MEGGERRAGACLLRLFALAAMLRCAAGAGVFELQVLEFSNYRLQRANGACCAGGDTNVSGAVGGAGSGACGAPCRTRFTLCLKEYQSAAARGACSFGRASSPVLGTDSFTLAEPLYTLALPFTFRWTRSFTLILEAYDDHEYADPDEALLEAAWWSGIVEPGAAWHALRHAGAAAALAFRVRVLCAPHYYNTTCTTFCRARDDAFGHYACDAAGGKTCLDGWSGATCETPVCKPGCHPAHGHCERPAECDCRPGWRGELCDQCQPYPGCKHGYCNGSAWDCTCDTNWGGILCDQDLNYCGTHEPCQNGGTCENTAPDQYLCTCADGFSGADCERVDNPCAPQPCAHGACALAPGAPGFTCRCEPGWTGARCDRDEDDCASSPCAHGRCRDLLAGFACDCAPGWTGPACDRDEDECARPSPPCVNAATCDNTPGGYTCGCLPGWGGRDCDVNADDCAGQCLHGATCIDLVDDFHCACAAGWAGRTCARDVDECAPRPCRNGGECVDLLDAYRCICPVGYSGHDCELAPCRGRYCEDDRDHCAPAPCGNGAACYTAQSDYYCHCARGWTGKNCTVRVPARELDECESSPCHNNGTCVSAIADFTCICAEGWTGKTCETRLWPLPALPAPSPTTAVEHTEACGGCLHGGVCVRGACACVAGWEGARCELPREPPAPAAPAAATPAPVARTPAPAPAAPPLCAPACSPPASCADTAAGARCLCPDDTDPPCLQDLPSVDASCGSAAGWWGCNVCACGACTRLWCGEVDCRAPRAAACRADEVCVPAAPALCLRAPCASPGECRRLAGRRVQPPAPPAPVTCTPGTPGPATSGCRTARLLLAPARLLPGAHVEAACGALRRALAAALHAAGRRAPLVLLCDVAPGDALALDLALWAGEDEEAMAGDALQALGALLAARRLPPDALLAAAAALLPAGAGGAGAGGAGGAGAAPAAGSGAWLAAGGVGAALAGALLAAAATWYHRRRATEAARARHDEEKSNNLQNEENLRRYANPLRAAAPLDACKARNTAPPPRDKPLPRALPPPAPPERLTVVV